MAVTYSQNGVIVRRIESIYGSVVIGGHSYKIIKMPDGKEWLAENLDYKWSGLDIGSAGTPTTPAAWYYNNDEAAYGIDGTYKCGLLYNWYAAKYLDDNKATLLPNGWHVPSDAEWVNMLNTIGGLSRVGFLIKAPDNSITSNWPSNWGGIDLLHFGAVSAGDRTNGIFGYIDTNCAYHTTTTGDSSTKCYVIAIARFDRIENYSHPNKVNAYSLRLVRDAP